MKVFISIPMRNKTEQQIEHDMIEAQYNIKNLISKKYPNEEIIFIDSFLAGAESLSPLFCLGYSLQSLSKADIAYFCAGWESSRGCVTEHHCAVTYGISCLYENNLEQLLDKNDKM